MIYLFTVLNSDKEIHQMIHHHHHRRQKTRQQNDQICVQDI